MIRVLTVHEHRLFGEVIACALRERGKFGLWKNEHNVDRVLNHLETMTVDVVLISMTIPDNAALPLVRSICSEFKKIKVVACNLIRSKSAIVQCLEEGINGYVFQDESLSDVVRVVWETHQEQFQISPEITTALVARMAELKRMATTIGPSDDVQIENNFAELTPREHEVLELLAKGQSNQEIASALIIEVGTVKNHVHNIFRKLDIHERQHAAAIAQYIL